MNKKTKCLLCDKESEDDEWNTSYDREQQRTEHLFDVFSGGVNQLAKTAFYNPYLAEIR